MNDGHDRSGARIRGLLAVTGTVATAAGLHTVVTGGRSYPPWQSLDPMVDSELRFYSAFYVAYGLGLLAAARNNATDPPVVRRAAAGMLGGGVARAIGWLEAGRPHPLQRALLAIELAGPLAVLAAQRDRKEA